MYMYIQCTCIHVHMYSVCTYIVKFPKLKWLVVKATADSIHVHVHCTCIYIVEVGTRACCMSACCISQLTILSVSDIVLAVS